VTTRLHLSLILAACAFVLPVRAQTQEAPPAATRKIAVTSLVGDQMAITVYRERAGTNVASNPVNHIKMPGPVFDQTVLKAVSAALEKENPKPVVAMLRVPAAGSELDPAQFLADGKVPAANPLIDALRKQGYTHLIAATKLRARNTVKLADKDIIGTGHLEGLGFYLDYTINVQATNTTESKASQGIIAPHTYLQLNLVDLGSLQVVKTEQITASAVRAQSADNASGTDPWGAMTPEQKLEAINRLLERSVTPATAALFAPK
jgi:hypothetical protein